MAAGSLTIHVPDFMKQLTTFRTWGDDPVRAQRLADGFASVDWVRVLGRYVDFVLQVDHALDPIAKSKFLRQFDLALSRAALNCLQLLTINDPFQFSFRRGEELRG